MAPDDLKTWDEVVALSNATLAKIKASDPADESTRELYRQLMEIYARWYQRSAHALPREEEPEFRKEIQDTIDYIYRRAGGEASGLEYIELKIDPDGGDPDLALGWASMRGNFALQSEGSSRLMTKAKSHDGLVTPFHEFAGTYRNRRQI